MNLDKRLLHLVKDSRLFLVLTIGLGLLAGVFTVVQAGLLSQVIGKVFLEGETLAEVTGLLEFLLIAITIRAVTVWGSEVSASTLAIRIKTSLRSHLFKHILELGPTYARAERTGELTSVLVEGIEALETYFSQYLPGLVLAALIPLAYLVFIFPRDILTATILLLTAPLIPLFMVLIGNKAQELTQRQWRTLSHMNAYFLDMIQGLTTLKTLGHSKEQSKAIAIISDKFRLRTMSVLRVTFLSALTLEMVATLSTAIIAVEIGLRVLYGRLYFEQALFLLILAPEFYLPLRSLGARFHAGMSGIAAAKRIFEILETPITSNAQQSSLDQEITGTNQETQFSNIQFNDVHFTYSSNRPALNGVSLQILAGQKVALVGPSGAGKSTIAGMLLRFIGPSSGSITIDGQPLLEIQRDDWLNQVSWVPQHPYLFNDTIATNIRLARPEASLDEVKWAAQQAHAHEFINKLPHRYNTVIGERATHLSGGQAQRIALARAFLKDSPFIILDEATANLDPLHEIRLVESLEQLLENKTALIIAHRLNTVAQADQIYLLDKGEMLGTGVHRELIQTEGLYQQLVRAYVETMVPTSHSKEGTIEIKRTDIPPMESVIPFKTGFVTPGMFTEQTYSYPKIGASSSIKTFKRLLSYLKPYKWLVALSILVGFATVASGVGLMTTSSYIISAAALHPSIAVLQVAIVGVRFFGISRGVFRYLERLLSHQVTFRLLARMRVWFFSSLEPLAPARITRYQGGDLLARIVGDIESLESFYVRAIAPPLVAVLVALVVGFFLSRFDPLLGFVLVFNFFLAGVCLPILIRLLSQNAGQRAVEQRTTLNIMLVDGIQGMADLLAFNQGEIRSSQIAATSKEFSRTQMQMARINGLQSSLVLFLANLCMWAVLLLAIPLVTTGQIGGVYLAVLVMATLTSFEAVIPLPQAAQYLEINIQAARRLFEISDTEPEVKDPELPQPVPSDFKLEVKHLHFRYPLPPSTRSPILTDDHFSEDDPWILDDLSFNMPQGKHLAIIGPSGGGKSTIVNLLLRFWEYNEGGHILLGDDELRAYNQDELRRHLGVVPQSIYLFNASIRENLRIARTSASQVEIEQAARQAQIHDFILTLPDAYDTWVGEQGLRLSAGERQRVAIARAILVDAPMLILDETTANLDSITGRQVLRALQEGSEGRSMLLITHRLVGLETMDEILVLDNGKVVERGRHEGLMTKGGLYRQMWDLQRQLLVEDVF